MKTKNKISIPLLILAISAFVAHGALSEVEAEAESGCGHKPGNLHHGPSKLELTPHTVEICPGYEFKIRIVKPIGKGEAKTTAKPLNPDVKTWLDQKNDQDSQEIVIPVPAGTPYGDYDYEVWVTGVGMLDPRVRVKK
jgi:hypothetical protein